MSRNEKNRFQIPCAHSHEKIWFTTQKSHTQDKCSKSLYISNPKGRFKRKTGEAAQKNLLPVSHKGWSLKLNYLEYNQNIKSHQGQGILEFSLNKAGGKKTEKRTIKVSFSLVFLCRLIPCLPKASGLHFHLVALFSIPGLLMELKSMTISVLLGLNCLPKHKRRTYTRNLWYEDTQ